MKNQSDSIPTVAGEAAHTKPYGKFIALDAPLTIKTTAEGPSLRDSNGQRIAECYLESQAMEIREAVNSFQSHQKEIGKLRNAHAGLVAALEKAEVNLAYAHAHLLLLHSRNIDRSSTTESLCDSTLDAAQEARAALQSAKQ